nr:CLK4-associating serine/arginine rich protein-like [Anser cygnoides]
MLLPSADILRAGPARGGGGRETPTPKPSRKGELGVRADPAPTANTRRRKRSSSSREHNGEVKKASRWSSEFGGVPRPSGRVVETAPAEVAAAAPAVPGPLRPPAPPVTGSVAPGSCRRLLGQSGSNPASTEQLSSFLCITGIHFG